MRTLDADSSSLTEGDEPILVIRKGKVSGLYVPLEEPAQIPNDLRRDLMAAVGRHIAGVLKDKGVSEEEILEDFGEFRRHRR